MERRDTRITYLDSLGMIGVFLVFFTHYINRYGQLYLHYFHDFPFSIFLYGISGKMGVAILAVIMGMLAYQSQRKLSRAILHRYCFFLVSVFVINCAYVLWNYFREGTMPSFWNLIGSSLLLKDTFFPALWFIKDFFLGYVFSVLNKCGKIKWGGVLLEILVLLIFSEVWVSICLVGNIGAQFEDLHIVERLKQKKTAKILVMAIIWIITKLPVETNMAFVGYGVSCLLFILLIKCSNKLRRIIEFIPISFLGKYRWGFFLVHAILYNIIGSYIIPLSSYSGTDYRKWFILAFLLCCFLTALVSIPLTKGIRWTTKRLEDHLLHWKAIANFCERC